MSDKRFILMQDNDSHWFVVPADKEAEADAYFQAVDKYWSEGNYENDPPATPDYLVEVGGAPSLVKFTGYVIE